MDRGFGSTFRSGGGRGGMNNSTPSRDRFSRDERRYDDFYSDNNNRRTSGGGGSNVNRNVPSNNAPNRNNNNNRGGWGNTTPTPRDRGFFNQGGSRDRGGAPPAGNNVSGQMLAALQQQQSLLSAFMNNQQQTRNRGGRGGGILGSGGNKFQGNRFNNRDNRGGNRAGDKRRQDPPQGNNQFKRNRRSAQGLPSGINPNKTTPNKASSVKATTPKIERKLAEAVVKTKEEEVEDIPDEDVVIPDSLMDSVERLRQRKEIERNVADEDVQKLVVFLFTGKGYQCATCGLLLSKEEGFVHHLMGKSHVMNVIDARSAKKYQTVRDILDIDLSPDDWFEQNEQAKAILFKQAKLFMKAQREIERRAKENYDKTPSNFFSVRMESRKSALKKEDTVIITSLVESTIEIKDFSKDRFFGCEFVKAVTGFQCRLCHIQIKEASDVIPHVNSKVHRNNYQMHLNKNKGYEKVQKDQNKELLEVLSEHEEKNVLLYESPKANDGVFLNHLDADLVRDKKLLEPPVVKKPETTIDKKEAIKKDGDKVDVKEEEDDAPNVEGESEEANEDATTEVKEELKNDAALKDELKNDATLKDEKKEDDVTNDDAQETDEHGEDENDGEYDEAMEEDTAKEGDDGETNEDGEQNEESESKGEEATEEHVENGSEEAELNDEVEDESKSTKVTKKTAGGGRGKGKRARGRGAKVTPSPRSRRAAAIKAAEEISEEVAEEQGDEASFMDSFQVVDEVADE